MTRSPIRVLVVDDHPVVRRGIEDLLASATDIEVVGSTGSGAEAARLAETLDPHVVLMDIEMPDVDGVEATRRVLAVASAEVRAQLVELRLREELINHCFGTHAGHIIALILAAIFALLLLSAVNTAVMAMVSVMYGLGHDEELPKRLTRLNYSGVPWIGLIIACLLPVKISALWLIAHGHALLGLEVIIAAKLAGTVLVARIFVLTKPQLMTLAWFATLYLLITKWRNALYAWVKTSAAWQRLMAVRVTVRAWFANLRKHWKPGRIGRRFRAIQRRGRRAAFR